MGIHKEAVFGILVMALGLSACNGSDGGSMQVAQDQVNGAPATIPPGGVGPGSGTPTTGGDPSTAKLGNPCSSSDSSHMCLALKYVVYKNPAGSDVVGSATALSNLATINSIWSQCNISFQIDEFVEVNPTDYGLNYNTPTQGELDSIRSAFVDKRTLLVATTGAWSGSLGAGAANAWTTLPGGGNYGVVLEGPVGNFAPIIAHELGHYLNLDHVSDGSDVMNPIISSSSTGLRASQCSAARSAVSYYWTAMLR